MKVLDDNVFAIIKSRCIEVQYSTSVLSKYLFITTFNL